MPAGETIDVALGKKLGGIFPTLWYRHLRPSGTGRHLQLLGLGKGTAHPHHLPTHDRLRGALR